MRHTKAGESITKTRRTFRYLEVVRELCPTSIPRIHGDERAARVYQVEFRTLEDETRQASSLRLLNAQYLARRFITRAGTHE